MPTEVLVFVSFEVDFNGNVVNPKIVKGMSEEYNQEALSYKDYAIMLTSNKCVDGNAVQNKLILPVWF